VSETVLQSLDDGVLTLTLNRPAKKNAFSREQWAAFADALAAAQQDRRVAVVLLTGAGGNFSSGTDLTEFANADAEHPFGRCVEVVCGFDKPLLGAATGIAVGGGATLLLHCDLLYAGEGLRMRFPFVSLALVPEFGSSYRLQAAIGPRRAAELLFTAEWIGAARALETGIATAVLPDAELLAHAQAKAREIAAWPVNALQETKRTLLAAHRAGLERALDVETGAMQRCVGSAENTEAITAFLERRAPDFRRFRCGTAQDPPGGLLR
jgi:enoyl-CoA hydratase/carnithine racemase